LFLGADYKCAYLLTYLQGQVTTLGQVNHLSAEQATQVCSA